MENDYYKPKDVLFPHKIKKRTRHIWMGGTKYHRRAMYHGYKIYIICFFSEVRAQIEYASGEQKIIHLDDEQLELKEYVN